MYDLLYFMIGNTAVISNYMSDCEKRDLLLRLYASAAIFVLTPLKFMLTSEKNDTGSCIVGISILSLFV